MIPFRFIAGCLCPFGFGRIRQNRLQAQEFLRPIDWVDATISSDRATSIFGVGQRLLLNSGTERLANDKPMRS
jgi:hypothetical protein